MNLPPEPSSHPQRVAFLGPPGSFSHQAALAIFGEDMDQHPLADPRQVISAVANPKCEVTHAVVPVLNAVCGAIEEVVRLIGELPVQVQKRRAVPVELCLVGSATPKQIHSKREVFAQCQRWLRRHHPDADCIEAPSSSAAIQTLAKANAPHAAAIGSALAAELHAQTVVATGIADLVGNQTEFAVLVARSYP